MERHHQPEDQVHTHVTKQLSNLATNGSQSKSVDKMDSLARDPQTLMAMESQSIDSLNEQPRRNLLRKWQRKQQ